MAEYIKREDAYRTLSNYYHHSTDNQHMALRGALDRVPAADVVGRKTGKWRRYSPLTDTFECDQCGYQVIDKEFRTNFCPNCGCAMEGTK